MKRSFLFLICALLLFGSTKHQDKFVQNDYADTETYMKARQRLIEAELALRFDAGTRLTREEEEANRRLMALKQKEFERTRSHFPPAHNFLESRTKDMINQSPILEIMKRMPKGGILHVHGLALGDFRWLVSQAAYQPNCYIYLGKEKRPVQGTLRISPKSPGEGWQPVTDLRQGTGNLAGFDEKLYRSITLGEEDLSEPDIWEEFSNCFRRSFGLFSYDPLYEGFCRKMLKDVAEENVQYVEFRGILGRIDEILKEIQRNHPEFNVKYVYCGGRSNDHEQVAKSLNWLLEQRKANPHLIKGFDLVEEEDRTHTNLYFINELLNARREAEKRNITLPLYLHSGESNWVENENVYDAILLDAKRIGHGLALVKHPLLMQIAKERNIAIEICPISNQVLGYIPDLRNHPAITYINSGLPIVLSPDDPGIMRYTFSYDFYVAFMAWGLDLRCLKQLAVNSLLYSAMDPEEKNKALETWKKKWADFVTWLAAYPLN